MKSASIIVGAAVFLCLILDSACSKTNGDQTAANLPRSATGLAQGDVVPEHCKPTYVPKGDNKIDAMLEGLTAARGSESDRTRAIAEWYSPDQLSKIWAGCPIDHIAAMWGAPSREVSMPGGATVLVWQARESSPKLTKPLASCEISITANSAGAVEGVSAKESNFYPSSIVTCQIDRRTGPYLENTGKQ